MKICVPIVGPTMEYALHDFGIAVDQGADILELRLDLMDSFNLEKLISKAPLETIVTIRAKNEWGSWSGTERQRYRLFNEAAENNATYIDIEAKNYRQEKFNKRKSKLILSHHDFKKTPDNLEVIFQNMMKYNPDIIKIAAMAQKYEDCLRMLNFVKNASKINPVIGICMDDKGIITRIIGPQSGSYLTFCSLEGKASAPGQITISELKEAHILLNSAQKK